MFYVSNVNKHDLLKLVLFPMVGGQRLVQVCSEESVTKITVVTHTTVNTFPVTQFVTKPQLKMKPRAKQNKHSKE